MYAFLSNRDCDWLVVAVEFILGLDVRKIEIHFLNETFWRIRLLLYKFVKFKKKSILGL